MDVQKLFKRFNRKYFGGRLPTYRVTQSDLYGSMGVCRKKQREIHLSAGLQNSAARTTLLHEMAHAATSPRHGPAWQKEIRRLIRLGAPLKRELDAYLKTTGHLGDLISDASAAGFHFADRQRWPEVRQHIGYKNGLLDKNGNAESARSQKDLQRIKLAFLSGVKETEYIKKQRAQRLAIRGSGSSETK